MTYSVYRSTDPAFTPSSANRVASGLTATTHTDLAALDAGTSVTYVVRAVDSANAVADGNLVRLSAAPSGPYTLGNWADDAGDTGTAKLVTTFPWTAAASGGYTAPKVYATGAYDDLLCAGATTATLHLGSGAQLGFWSHHALETGWDKGEVQLSTDGGSSWNRVAVAYPTSSSYTSDACGLPTGTYFTGTSAPWTSYSASLAAWAERDVLLRWVLSTDTSANGAGWWVDDITISNVMVPGTCVPGEANAIFADGFEGGATSGWSNAVP